MKTDTCRNCGAIFRGRNDATSRSRKCAAESRFQFGEDNPNWKGGINPKIKGEKYRKKYPERYFAHNKAWNAIRKGILTPSPCEKCGHSQVEAHHDNYLQPLSVRWLCKQHHLEEHG